MVADGGDRRASRVALTESGRRAAADLARQEAAFAASIVNALGSSGTAEVLAAMERLLGAIRTASAGCCPGAFGHLMSSSEWTAGRTHHEQ